jgi:hypothetical protein
VISTRNVTDADLSLGLSLARQVGWNRTEADRVRPLELQPDGCFDAEWSGTPTGTVTT